MSVSRCLLAGLLAAWLSACAGDDAPDDPGGHTDDPVHVDPDDRDGDGVPAPEDCDDEDPTVHPGAVEIPLDGVDQDCDGLEACAEDADGDGFGGGGLLPGPLDCDAPGLAPVDGDCDDDDPAVHPGAVETCDGVDEDCNGVVDDVVDPPRWRLDRDGDGWGDPRATFAACEAPPGFIADAGPADCDDLEPTAFPGAVEIPADGIDQDCDGVDLCYADVDADGYGSDTLVVGTTLDCSGFYEAARSGDCDDLDPFTHPGAVERCGLTDHDCDGVIGDLDDDAIGERTWYLDVDGDGFGSSGARVFACLQPEGAVAVPGDCNDDRDDIFPGADEVCDGFDNDCDGRVDDEDDDVVGAPTWHRDRDEDGYGDPDATYVACQPLGEFTTLDGTDCDDGLALRNPGATESIGNNVDEDCDGLIGCFVDRDGDGLAGREVAHIAAATCNTPGYGQSSLDCDDDDPDIQQFTYWADLDGDGWGRADQTVKACVQPVFFTDRPGDCRDTDPNVHPEGIEHPGDLVDGDCDGQELCFVDADGDGWGGPETVLTPDLTCAAPGLARSDADCDDDDPDISPSAQEQIGDEIDSDCDGTELCFLDADGDGWGGRSFVTVPGTTCDFPFAAADPGDCDDDDPAVSPSAAELCAAGDENCNGLEGDDDPTLVGAPTWWRDGDGDGLGDPAAPVTACAAPPAHVANADDCADDLSGWGLTCPWAAVVAGDGFTCGRRTDGEVACAGEGPAAAAPAGAFRDVDAAGEVACAVGEDGALACWGAPGDPRLAAPPGAFTAVAVGATATCALDGDGAPVCWGDPSLAPPPVAGLVDLAVGDTLACGWDGGGAPTCWGDDPCGGTPGGSVAHLALEDGVACALDPAGRLSCGGCVDPRADDAPVEPLLRFLALDVGPAAACAVTVTGDPTCWGTLPAVAPVPAVPSVDVAVGGGHACLLGVDRVPACWGAPASALTLP